MNKRTIYSLLLMFLLASIVFLSFDDANMVKAAAQGSVAATSVKILSVTSQQSFVEQGFLVNLTATVENIGSSTATFDITFLGNGMPLNTQSVSLVAQSSSLVIYDWNTTGFALGNYTLSANIYSTSGETTTAEASYVGSKLLITCPGDLNGGFGVDFNDILTFVGYYINYSVTGYCNPAADFNHDGKLDFNALLLFVGYYIAYYSGPTPFVTDGGLTLTMSIEKTTFSLGEPVNFTLSVNNVSKSVIDFERSASTFDYIVYNSTGIVYRYSSGIAFPMWVMQYSLQPGQSLTQNFSWTQICNLYFGLTPSATSALPLSCAVSPVSPGTYYIVGEALGMQTPAQQITIA